MPSKNIERILIEALQSGDRAIFRAALGKSLVDGAGVDIKRLWELVAEHGHPEQVDVLLPAWPCPQNACEDVWRSAFLRGAAGMVQKLATLPNFLARTPAGGNTPWHILAHTGTVAMIPALDAVLPYTHSENTAGWAPIMVALGKMRLALIRHFHPVIVADEARLAGVDDDRQTLWHMLAEDGDLEGMALWHTFSPYPDEPDSGGYTPLGLALTQDNPAAAEYLLRLGAEFSAACYHEDIWHTVARYDARHCIPLLDAHHPHQNTQNEYGVTPAGRAIEFQQWDVMFAMLDRGADLTLPDSGGRGRTAWETLPTEQQLAVLQRMANDRDIPRIALADVLLAESPAVVYAWFRLFDEPERASLLAATDMLAGVPVSARADVLASVMSQTDIEATGSAAG